MKHLGIWLITRMIGLLALLAAMEGPAASKGTEILFVYPPDGWQLKFQTQVNDIRVHEYLPATDTINDWTEMITVQIITNTGDLNPTEIARTLRTHFITECGKVFYRGPDRFNLGGYLAVRLYIECSDPVKNRQAGSSLYRKHEVVAFQIIQGKTDIYVIERAWRGGSKSQPGAPYGNVDLWGWDGFWHGVEICDSAELRQHCFGLGILSPETADIFVSRVNPQLPYGCGYFRILSVLPDQSNPAKPTMVVPIKLGIGSPSDSKDGLELVAELLTAANQNRSVAVILTIAQKAQTGIYRTDAAKAQHDAKTLRRLLVKGGINASRLVEAINPSCPGP